MAAVNTTAKIKCGAVRNELVLQNKTENTAVDYRAKSRRFAPCRQDCFLYRGRLECARRAMLLKFVGCFQSEYDLGTISNLIFLLFLLTSMILCLFKNNPNLMGNQAKAKVFPNELKHYMEIEKAESTRTNMSSIYPCGQAG